LFLVIRAFLEKVVRPRRQLEQAWRSIDPLRSSSDAAFSIAKFVPHSAGREKDTSEWRNVL
jgi:hypothetical protein